MKKFYSKFRIGLMTFALGLASVFIMNGSLQFSDEIYVNLPETESGGVTQIITKRNWEGFELFGHGCGGRNEYGGEGSVTAYETNDFRRVTSEISNYSTAKGAEKELNERMSEATIIWSFTKKRIVLETERDNYKWANIITFEKKNQMKILTAESVELATKFEKWLESE